MPSNYTPVYFFPIPWYKTMTSDPFHLLTNLYQAMDKSWDSIAAQYQFQCNGCEDNCCQSLFFHHTHIEKAYLRKGFNQLDTHEKNEILKKAKKYCESTFAPDKAPSSLKILCPLILKGQCRLYEFRPMICRMHGLPHELHRPGQPTMKGPGCTAGRFVDKTYIAFDRTPFYRKMAQAEMEFRSALSHTGRIKETIAQMLVNKS